MSNYQLVLRSHDLEIQNNDLVVNKNKQLAEEIKVLKSQILEQGEAHVKLVGQLTEGKEVLMQ